MAINSSEYGAYPWDVVILSSFNEYIGAGVLIDHRHVLTVAHKIYKSWVFVFDLKFYLI